MPVKKNTEIPKPKRGSKEWEKYILDKTEMKEGHPTFDSLYKVCQVEFGDILEFHTECIQSPSTNNRWATIKTTILVKSHHNNENYLYSDIADCYRHDIDDYNVNEPFSFHLTSTAATKSAGRALRRILCIDCITVEEKAENITGERITQLQCTIIENSCKNLSIDIEKFLAKSVSLPYDEFGSTSKDIAVKLIATINQYENNTELIPKEILNESTNKSKS